jgi:uncharacterized RDD family membrane protein YckC
MAGGLLGTSAWFVGGLFLSIPDILFMQANIRYWSKLISILMLRMGFFMIALPPKKQGIHDMLAKTTVIKK